MIVSALAAVETGTATFTSQPASGVTLAKKIDKAEAILDWSRPAAELARAVRAFRPNPGATSTLGGAPVKIWTAAATQGTGPPGQILSADRGAIVVACGSGALAVTELQRAGGKRLSATDFLRGQPLASGARFGQSAQRA
jgi:methionyl-tRNA formyltransferase